MKTINEVLEHRKHLETTVSPGLPQHLGEGNSVNDEIWQGDLGILVVDRVPKGYVQVKHPKDEDRQLVPLDGSPGSHHRIRSWDGVKLYRPKDWGKNPESLEGPCVVWDKPNAIVHESGTACPHGTVFIDSPTITLHTYQRNLDVLEAVERRSRD